MLPFVLASCLIFTGNMEFEVVFSLAFVAIFAGFAIIIQTFKFGNWGAENKTQIVKRNGPLTPPAHDLKSFLFITKTDKTQFRIMIFSPIIFLSILFFTLFYLGNGFEPIYKFTPIALIITGYGIIYLKRVPEIKVSHDAITIRNFSISRVDILKVATRLQPTTGGGQYKVIDIWLLHPEKFRRLRPWFNYRRYTDANLVINCSVYTEPDKLKAAIFKMMENI